MTERRAFVALLDTSVDNKLMIGIRGPSCKNAGQWNLFGGNVDEGESPLDAVARELREETGISFPPTSLIFQLLDCTIFKKKEVFLYIATFNSRVSQPRPTSETVGYAWSAPGDLDIPRPSIHYSLQLYLDHLNKP